MSEAATEERPDIVTVDNASFDKFVDEKLGVTPDPEAAAEAELVKVEAEKAERLAAEKADEDPTHDLGETVPKEKKGKLNERFSELTAKRKEAEAKAQAEATKAREASERADALQRERDELKAKYEPVKTTPDAEPLPEQFVNQTEFLKARDEWVADRTRREDAKKADEQRQIEAGKARAKAWAENEAALKAEVPDYEETLKNSPVMVSDQVSAAIAESEFGPKIALYLAKNPEVAASMATLTVAGAIRQIGRIEASFEAKEERPAKAGKPVAEISKARPPISPLKGTDAPVVTLRGSDPVPQGMLYDDWKALYQAGKIK